jgi:hypothetical protein
MRYFEIVKPPVQTVLADADPKETAPGQTRNGTIETAGERCLSNLLNRINLPSRRSHLSPRRLL